MIPIGTGNDFVKYFEGLKREDFLNLANYSDPEYMDCDLIKVNGEYSINTVSFGFDVEVARQVNALKKNIKTEGIIPYVLSTLISLRKPIGQDYQIQMRIDFMDSIFGKTETISLDVDETCPCSMC